MAHSLAFFYFSSKTASAIFYGQSKNSFDRHYIYRLFRRPAQEKSEEMLGKKEVWAIIAHRIDGI
jgi:hypothetical protein